MMRQVAYINLTIATWIPIAGGFKFIFFTVTPLKGKIQIYLYLLLLSVAMITINNQNRGSPAVHDNVSLLDADIFVSGLSLYKKRHIHFNPLCTVESNSLKWCMHPIWNLPEKSIPTPPAVANTTPKIMFACQDGKRYWVEWSIIFVYNACIKWSSTKDSANYINPHVYNYCQ